MTFDPYAVLGLHGQRCQATAEEITAAFRRRSKETHPDLNPGDPAKAAQFDRVRRAHDILRDPAKRARYDETGEVEEETATNGDEGPWGIIADMLAKILGSDADPFKLDLVGVMRATLDEEIAQAEKTLGKLRRAEARAGVLAGRFTRKPKKADAGDANAGGEGESNMLQAIMASHKTKLGEHIRRAEQALAPKRRARELISDYAFRADEVPQMVATFYGQANSNTAAFSVFGR